MNLSKSAKKSGFSMLRFLWHGPRTSQTVSFVGHAYRPRLLWPASHVLSAHAYNSPSIRRKRSSTKHILVDQCCSCSTQIHADAARGVCALESSRSCIDRSLASCTSRATYNQWSRKRQSKEVIRNRAQTDRILNRKGALL